MQGGAQPVGERLDGHLGEPLVTLVIGGHRDEHPRVARLGQPGGVIAQGRPAACAATVAP
ncbi:hypothetical protein ND748_08345 [Frankia sp. AiPs1]|uniref:hypothetical protein n=1 Tax=Frankia sp. AiPs1 TaxID=573493 RepID=UPI0020448E17|nr:hypothetical protein [Frankia sp. AiPs1]MCM3921672.1 hypothetical protein [Frankia sp. AiPs1]